MLEAVIDAFVGKPFVSDTDSVTFAEGRSLPQSFVEVRRVPMLRTPILLRRFGRKDCP